MTKRNIKMIGIDLDGTLLTSKKVFTEHTKEILIKAMDQGVIVLPATGRPLSGIPREILEFPGIRYVLSANGARLLDMKEKKVLYEKLVPYEISARLLDIFSKYDTILEIYYDGVGYAEAQALNRIGHFLKEKPMADYIRSTRRPVEDIKQKLKETGRPSDKVQAIFPGVEERNQAAAEAIDKITDIEITGALGNNIEVNAKGVSKGAVLIYLADILGIKREEVMAFGDGSNDVDMLREAGFGVAMGNSIEVVKAAADYITLSNDEEGVAHAIEKYVLK